MWKPWAGLAGLSVAVVIAGAAFAVPWLMFPDADHEVDAMTVRYTQEPGSALVVYSAVEASNHVN